MRATDWNRKYDERPLVWGAEPNRHVAAELASLRPGRALDLACGEGRNAIWLAGLGWEVTGVDFADVAVARGLARAAGLGLAVDLRVGDVLSAEIAASTYDLVLLCYLQLPPHERRAVVERASTALAPGATFLLVAHDARNLAEGTGGPSNPEVLWSAADATGPLEAAGLEIEKAGTIARTVVDAERPAIDTLVRARRPG
jgi:SAM-dependent methyltransferase